MLIDLFSIAAGDMQIFAALFLPADENGQRFQWSDFDYEYFYCILNDIHFIEWWT